jgi:hypothetical protein
VITCFDGLLSPVSHPESRVRPGTGTVHLADGPLPDVLFSGLSETIMNTTSPPRVATRQEVTNLVSVTSQPYHYQRFHPELIEQLVSIYRIMFPHNGVPDEFFFQRLRKRNRST